MTASEPTLDVSHYPRLTRFYHLTPAQIAGTPRCILKVYLDQLPVLEAEEQLARIQASDQPHLEAKDRERTHRALLRLAEMEAPSQTINPLAQDGENMLAGMGIRVVRGNA